MTGERDVTRDADRLFGRDYWLVRWEPSPQTDRADLDAVLDEHIAWLLGLERDDVLFLSGPLLSGPGTRPGSGVTVFRAEDEQTATALAAEDPFVKAGLRSFSVHRWRLNEGSVSARLSLGTGRYEWG
jgi:uncharacterized protein